MSGEISRVTAKEAAKLIRPGTVKTVELLFQTSGGHVALVRVPKSQVQSMLRRLPDGASVSIEILKGFQKATIAGAIGPVRGGDLAGGFACEAHVMTIISAGIAQVRAPVLPAPEVGGIEPFPRSTASDRCAWQLGYDDAIAGRPWRVGPDEILAQIFDGDRDVLSYLVGYRAGQLDRLNGRSPCSAKQST